MVCLTYKSYENVLYVLWIFFFKLIFYQIYPVKVADGQDWRRWIYITSSIFY